MATSRPEEIRNALDLAGVGAERAAESVTALLDRPLRARAPQQVVATGGSKGETGVLFEMEGAVCGVVALLFSRSAREEIVEALGADTAPAVRQSALREFGNIVASQAVSAVADRIGARITLSVPTLVSEGAARVLEGLLSRRNARLVVSSGVAGSEGEPEVLLFFAPDAPS